MALITDYGFMRAADIHSFLSDANKFIKPQNKMAYDFFEQRIKELESFRDASAIDEQKVYDKFQVDGVEGMQKKLDTTLEDLSSFQNMALRKMPLVEAIDKNQAILPKIEEQIQEKINEWVSEDRKKQGVTYSIAQDHAAEALADFIEGLRKSQGNNVKVSKANIRKSLVKKRENGKTKISLKPGALKGYRRELEVEMFPDYKPEGATLSFSWEMSNIGFAPGVLNYYPYYKLTDEEKKFASSDEGDEIWELFKKQLLSLVKGKTVQSAKEVLDSGIIVREDFYVNSANEVIGVLGELQVLILFNALSNDTPTPSFVQFLGNATRGGKKVGIDVILDKQFGIQVKNYATYGKEGINEGINLRESLKLDTFLNKISSAASPEQIQTLADFYTIRAYHVQAHKDYAPTRKRLEQFDSRIKNFFQAYINYYLPLDTYDTVKRLGEDLTLNKGARNLFYFIGGRRLVPVSKILQSYITYLERMREGLLTKERRSMAVNYYYSGETYHKYHKLKFEDKVNYIYDFTQDDRYSQIANEITMDYTINLNIDYILNEIMFQ